MATNFSAGTVLEHVELNNIILAAKDWGVLDGLDVTQRGAGENMSVDVASGNCFINNSKYTEASTVNLAIEASHATLYRKDLITYDPTTSNPVVTKGTDHAGGTADPIYPPDIPAGDILLAIVNVDATVTTIVDADINDSLIIIDPGYADVLTSDTLHDSDDAEHSTTSATYVKIAELEITQRRLLDATFKIDFQMHAAAPAATQTAYCFVRRNGVEVGAEQSTSSSSYANMSQSISGWATGDLIQIYGKKGSDPNTDVYQNNLRIYGIITPEWF